MPSPGSSPQVGVDASGEGFDSNLIWFNYPNGKEKIEYLDEVAGALGKCFVRLVIFCSELARLDLPDFKRVVDEFSDAMGSNPLGHEVFVELAVINSLGSINHESETPLVDQLSDIYTELQKSKARVMVSRVNGSNLFHLHILKPYPFCECSGPVCEHGWSARMCLTVMSMSGRRIGASGFDMNAFLDEMCDESRNFEESFSEFTATQPEASAFREGPPKLEGAVERDILMSSLMAQLATAEAKVKSLHETLGSQTRPATPPMSPERQHQPIDASFNLPKVAVRAPETICPADSSSVIERYSKRFMEQGTVFSIKEQALNQQFKAPRLVVDDGLVSGFTVSPTMAKRESERVSKLSPINGLPKPFTNTRLNFLCNFHTALTGRLSRGDGNYLDSLYRAMKDTPRLPHDNLLKQVLLTSIDLTSKTWCSNAFELPYVEVGMLFTEDSVVKMFDLLQLEYKRVWFQEFKSLVVPSFHGDYKGVSTNLLSSRNRGSNSVHKESSSSEGKRRRSSRSMLGF